MRLVQPRINYCNVYALAGQAQLVELVNSRNLVPLRFIRSGVQNQSRTNRNKK